MGGDACNDKAEAEAETKAEATTATADEAPSLGAAQPSDGAKPAPRQPLLSERIKPENYKLTSALVAYAKIGCGLDEPQLKTAMIDLRNNLGPKRPTLAYWDTKAMAYFEQRGTKQKPGTTSPEALAKAKARRKRRDDAETRRTAESLANTKITPEARASMDAMFGGNR